jgi:hypothetical protein
MTGALNGHAAPLPLTAGQDAVCNLLAAMLASAKRGEIDAVAMVAVNAAGRLLTDFKGNSGGECVINMGLDILKGNVALSLIQQQRPPTPRVLRPGFDPTLDMPEAPDLTRRT